MQDVIPMIGGMAKAPGYANATVFSRWFDTIRGGKHVVVVVIGEGLPQGRHWMVTGYLSRKVEEGVVLWKQI